jgi:hypothetical protein
VKQPKAPEIKWHELEKHGFDEKLCEIMREAMYHFSGVHRYSWVKKMGKKDQGAEGHLQGMEQAFDNGHLAFMYQFAGDKVHITMLHWNGKTGQYHYSSAPAYTRSYYSTGGFSE